MTDRVQFTVYGPPQGKGRPRFGKGRTYTPAKTRSYEGKVAWAAKRAMNQRQPFEGACAVAVVAYMAIPKSWPKWKQDAARLKALWPTVKPDADNVIKILADSINGVVWRDDVQMTDLTFSKRYATEARVEVSIVHLGATDRNVTIHPLEAA